MTGAEYNHINDVIEDLYELGKLTEEDFCNLCRWIDEADRLEKYRWHDLRKDHNDLPKDNDARSEYMVTDGNQYFISKYFGNGAYVNGCWEYPYGVFECNAYDIDVIAWREIEPFKERN